MQLETPETEFAALGAPAPLARALASRGYESPTAVQAVVLDEAHADRDLLVSSPTGSGKTVAFGLLLGRALLSAEEGTVERGRPLALVVVPTRELALQVQRELAWLFHGTRARVVSFTGGTDLRKDAHALQAGAELVVGTPGRLVDLLARKSLDLSSLRAVVLDEADEMLDLGFREALETILGQAPVERRTFLFSATLPPAIRALAARYQKNALALDTRKGSSVAHEDIEHVYHLVARGEKLAGVVNTLRQADDERAIVFCSTRATR
jgi:ATP-dependent RNA helicase DeaD